MYVYMFQVFGFSKYVFIPYYVKIPCLIRYNAFLSHWTIFLNFVSLSGPERPVFDGSGSGPG